MKEVCSMTSHRGAQRHTPTWYHRISLYLLPLALLLLAVPLSAQQTDVARFDAFVGYTFLDSPHVSLFENGIGGQFGVRPKTWLTVGVDYTFTRGPLTLTPNLLLPSLQQTLGAELQQLGAAGIPIPATILIPAHSVTQTIAA